MIEMASGKDPWSEKGFVTPYQAITYIGTRDEIPLIPATLSEIGHDFCRRCLTRNPDLRPSASELLKHPFVNAALGEEIVSPPSSAPSPTHSALRGVVTDTAGAALLSNLGAGDDEAARQLQRMSAMVDTKAQTMILQSGQARAARGQGDIPPPPPPPPPYPFVNSSGAEAMPPSGASPREQDWRERGCESSSEESTRSQSRVFHYSANNNDSGSVQSDMSLTSSVLSFVDGYHGLSLGDREPGAPH